MEKQRLFTEEELARVETEEERKHLIECEKDNSKIDIGCDRLHVGRGAGETCSNSRRRPAGRYIQDIRGIRAGGNRNE